MKRLNLNETNPTIINATIRKTQESTDSLVTTTADLQTATTDLQTTTAGLQTATASLQTTTASLQAKGSYLFPVSEYGAVADGVTDDTVAIQAAIDAAQTNAGGVVLFDGHSYLISSTLNVTKKSIRLVGLGSDTFHDAGADTPVSTTITWNGAADGTMVQFASPASTQIISGCGMERIKLDGSTIAGIGLYVYSVRKSLFSNLYVTNVRTAAYSTSCLPRGQTVEASDNTRCIFRNCEYRNIDFASVLGAHGFFLSGSGGSGNTCFSLFDTCSGQYKNGAGFLLDDADNNTFVNCTGFGTGGSGYAFDIYGGTTAGKGNGDNKFVGCSWPNANGFIIRGTEAFDQATLNNCVVTRDFGNSSQDPQLGTGSKVVDLCARRKSWNPTIASSVGAITSYSVVDAGYRVVNDLFTFSVTFLVSNNGTGSGAIVVTMPFAPVLNTTCVGRSTTGGEALIGLITAASTNLSVTTYNSGYPVTSANYFTISGQYFV